MKLKYSYTVRKCKIVIEMETVAFTQKENEALDMLGEPVIAFQKTYPGNFTVSLSKKIRSEFKTRVRIDGTGNMEAANEAGQQFLADIQEALSGAMEKLIDSYEDQLFPPKQGFLEISDYK